MARDDLFPGSGREMVFKVGEEEEEEEEEAMDGEMGWGEYTALCQIG